MRAFYKKVIVLIFWFMQVVDKIKELIKCKTKKFFQMSKKNYLPWR